MINKEYSIKLYQAILDSNTRREMEMWHASSLAQCPRAQYFHRLNIEELRKPTAPKVIRWQAGHHLETAIRPQVESVWGKTASNDRMTSKKLQLTGEFDNLTVNDKVLVEIKSVHDFALIERQGEWSLKEQDGWYQLPNPNTHYGGKKKWKAKHTPYLGHEIQNHGYVLLLEEQGIEVKRIDYVYITLSGRMVVYSTMVQEQLIESVRNRLKLLNKAWDSKTPPPCVCDEKHILWDSVLQWCDYRDEKSNTCCDLKLLEPTE